MTNDISAVLALAQGADVEETETDVPVPPNGSSEGATALHYALLKAYDFNLGELIILEQLVNTRTQLDEIEADWRRDGSPATALGSMQQPVTDPRVQELRQLRTQIQSLVKALNIPDDGAQERRRPGRPTRSQGGKWGAR